MRHLALPAIFLVAVACQTTTPPAADPAPRTTVAPEPANRMTPLGSSPRTIQPPLVRVGLLGDQSRIEFPRLPEGYILISDAGPSRLRRGFSAAAPLADAAVRYAVQVASLSDATSAAALEEKIQATTGGARINRLFDPAGGAYRIVAGDFESEEAARPLRDQLILAGYGREMPIVRRPADQPFQRVLRLTDDEGESYDITTNSLLIVPAKQDPVRIDGKPYRGGARLFINPRGLLNVINEVNLEDYVRGVVPRELGPRVYDELEAQKAQALAARTYVVKRLGEYNAEGYDICPTPACQVYEGMGVEEPLSDQAIRETAGLVIAYNGEPIDALFSSTCGGYTSDVGTMFPGRDEPYLKRARCIEAEMTPVAGRGDSGILSEMGANARLFSVLAGLPDINQAWAARDVATAVTAAAKVAGYTLPAGAGPASSRRRDVLAYLTRVWNLDEYGRVLLEPEDRRYFFPESRSEEPPYVAASFLIKYRVLPTQYIDGIDLDAAMPREELYALLFSWLQEMGTLTQASGRVASVSGRQFGLKNEGKTTTYNLPANIPILRQISERVQEYQSAPVMLGDRATVVQMRGQPAALLIIANYDGAAFDRTSSYSNWTRSWRADELVPVIARRNPIQSLQDIRILGTDASHRVTQLEVIAEGGRTFVLRGLPIRWSLNVPDNLFLYTKSKDPDGVDRYTFFGKGWGHGTGMCQAGAFGMATRGYKVEQIIKNYYTGVEIVPFSSLR